MTGQMPALTMPSLFEATSALLVTLADDPVLALTVPSKLQAYFAAGKPIVASVNGEAGRVVGAAGRGLSAEQKMAVHWQTVFFDYIKCRLRTWLNWVPMASGTLSRILI